MKPLQSKPKKKQIIKLSFECLLNEKTKTDLQAAKLPFGLARDLNNKVIVKLYENGLQVGDCSGGNTSIDFRNGSLSTAQKDQAPDMSGISADSLFRAINESAQVKSLRGLQKIQIAKTKITVSRYTVNSRSAFYDILTSHSFFCHPKTARAMWALWFKTEAPLSAGIPIQIIVRDKDRPEHVLMTLKLVKIGYAKPKDEGLFARGVPKPVFNNSNRIATRKKRQASTEALQITPRGIPITAFTGNNHDGKIGVAYKDGFLNDLERWTNNLMGSLPSFFNGNYQSTGGFSTDYLALSLPFGSQWFPNIRGSNRQIRALKALFNIVHVITRVSPRLRSNEYEEEELSSLLALEGDFSGGLSGQEESMFRLYTLVMSYISWDETEGWQPGLSESMGPISTNTLELIRNIQERLSFDPSNEADRDLIYGLATAAILGLTIPLPCLDALLGGRTFEQNVVLFENRDRLYGFLDAQIRMLLDIEIRISNADLTDIHIENDIFSLTPYPNQILFSGGTNELSGLNEQNSFFSATFEMFQFFFDLRIPSIGLADGLWLLDPILGVITAGRYLIYRFASGNLMMNLRDLTLDLSLELTWREEGRGLNLVVNNINWGNFGNQDFVFRFPEIMKQDLETLFRAVVRPILRNTLQNQINNALANAFTNMTILPWPNLLTLKKGPNLRSIRAPGTGEVMWAELTDGTAGNDSRSVGEVDLSDIHSFGYVFTPRLLAAWVATLLENLLERRTLNQNQIRGLVDLDLPALNEVGTPPEALEYQRSLEGPANAAAFRVLLVSDKYTSIEEVFEDFCGPKPLESPPRLTYRMRFIPRGPEADIPGAGVETTVGTFEIPYQILIEGVYQKWHIYPQMLQLVRPGEEHNCSWQSVRRSYQLDSLLVADIRVKGHIKVGFAAQDVGSFEGLNSFIPRLGLVVQTNNQGPITEAMTHDLTFSSIINKPPVEQIRTALEAYCQREVNIALEESNLTGTLIRGALYLLTDETNIITNLTNELPNGLTGIRLVQVDSLGRADVAEGERWNPKEHQFRYYHRNGHAIWPVRLQIDMDEILNTG